MKHYNLYTALALPENISAQDARQEINRRLENGETANPGGVEELNIALAILGQEQRKNVYDARLRDQDPDNVITIDALRQLAQLPVGGWNSSQPNQQDAQQSQPTPQNQKPGESLVDQVKTVGQHTVAVASSTVAEQTSQLRAEYKKSSRKALVATIIGSAAVTFLVCALLFSNPGEAWNEHKVAKVTNSILEAKSSAAVSEIIADSWPDKVGDKADDLLDVNDLVTGEFKGAKAFFETDKPKVKAVYKENTGPEIWQMLIAGETVSLGGVENKVDLDADDFGGRYVALIADEDGDLCGGISFFKIDGSFVPVAIDRMVYWD